MSDPVGAADDVPRGSRDDNGSEGDSELRDVVELIERVRSHTPDVLSDIFLGEPGVHRRSEEGTAAEPIPVLNHNHQLGVAPDLDAGENRESPYIQPVEIAHFKVEQHLGSGGSGVVFRAVDTRLKRVVALKVPHAEALVTKRLRDRFFREASAAAALDHRNIVPVYEAGTTNHVAYIAYAFCKGMTVEQWLAQVDSPLPGRLIARIVAEVADGIQHAHGRGVLHRDVKPSNVMIRFLTDDGDSVDGASTDLTELLYDADAEFEVRITDFGMARMQADDVETTRTGTILGTPAYMAPEQSRGARVEVGPPADVYGLGGLLYELITRRPPFEADNVVDMLQAVRNKTPQAPSKCHPDVSRELETLTLRCLDKEPSTRLPSAGFLADELRRYLEGKPIVSVPNSLPTAMMKWAGRHPAISSLTAALMLVGLCGALGIIWQWQNAERALAVVTKVEREKSTLLAQAEASLYRQQIDRIDSELAAGNFGQAARLLTECDVDQRGWEWDYLVRSSKRYERKFDDFELYPAGFDLNPDKTVMLTAETRPNRPELGGRWCLWDLASGRLKISRSFPEGGLYECAFSPDGATFATCAQLPAGQTGHSLVLWKTETGDELWRSGETSIAINVAFSPDGRTLATAGGDGRIRIWNARDGLLLKRLERHTDNVFSVEFHPTKEILASASRDGSARIWNYKTGECDRVVKLTSDLRCVRFDDAGKLMAVCGYRGCVQVFDVEDEFALVLELQPAAGPAGSIDSAAYYQIDFDPSGKELLGITSEGVAEVWDLSTGQKVVAHTLHDMYGSDCRWIDEDRFITSASAGRDIKIWNRHAFQVPRLAYPFGVNAAAVQFSPDGSAVLVGTQKNEARGGHVDTRLRLFDTRTMEVLQRFAGHEGWPKCAAFADHGKHAASGDDQGITVVWDVATGESLQTFSHDGQAIVDLSIVGQTLIVVTDDAVLYRRSIETGDVESQCQLSRRGITSAAFCSNRNELLTADDRTLSLWRSNDGENIHRLALPTKDDGRVDDTKRAPGYVDNWKLGLDPSGRWLAAANGEQIWFWDRRDVSNGLLSASLVSTSGGEISDIAFTHDGSRLASSQADSSIRIWELEQAAQILTLRGGLSHRGAFSAIAFSQDDAFLVGGRTQMALWDATPSMATSE